MVLGTPRGLRENALRRVDVRMAMVARLSGGLGPDLLGAHLVAEPVGTGRKLAGTSIHVQDSWLEQDTHFREGRTGSGSKSSWLDSKEQLVAP